MMLRKVGNRLKDSGSLGYLLFGLLCLVPILTRNQYYLHLIIMSSIFAVHTLGLNVISGLTGQMSLGQAGFYAIGAYSSALLAMNLGVPTWLSILLAGVISMVAGLAVALPVLRLTGIYLGMATYGFGKIVFVLSQNWESLTHGTYGLRRIPPLTLFGMDMSGYVPYYYVVLTFLLFFVVASARMIHSPMGQAMITIGEDELAAEFTGIDVTKHKVMAFAIGAAFSGVAGGLFAHYLSYISPEHFTHTVSLQILTMLVVGGRGQIFGAIGGAFLLTVLPEFLRMAPQVRTLMYGVLLVCMAVLRPQGVFGGIQLFRRRGLSARPSMKDAHAGKGV